MIETFIAVLLAHALADFVFQTHWMVARKRQPLVLGLHIAIYGVLTFALVGGHWPLALGLAALHLVIDAGKIWGLGLSRSRRLSVFLGDQALHGLTLVAAALYWPGAFGTGIWGQPPAELALLSPVLPYLTQGMLIAAGGILAVRMGQFVVEHLMTRFQLDQDTLLDGLPNGGAAIGLLERGLTFVLVVSGQPAGVGFLIAAKSFLRVGSIEKNRRMAEYVIIGTLASIGWALLVAFATGMLLERLP